MKQHLNTFIIGLSIVIVAAILGSSYSSKYKQNQTISVTGLGEENFTSDLIVWQANFSKRGTDLKAISTELNNDRSKIKKYLNIVLFSRTHTVPGNNNRLIKQIII